jgi:hypothetical protein
MTLEQWKREAHKRLDKLWLFMNWGRGQTYNWMAKRIGIPKSEFHIKHLDIEGCQRLIKILDEENL